MSRLVPGVHHRPHAQRPASLRAPPPAAAQTSDTGRMNPGETPAPMALQTARPKSHGLLAQAGLATRD